jgi:hypothetical protein
MNIVGGILLIGFGAYICARPKVVAEKLLRFYSSSPLVRYAGEEQLRRIFGSSSAKAPVRSVLTEMDGLVRISWSQEGLDVAFLVFDKARLKAHVGRQSYEWTHGRIRSS